MLTYIYFVKCPNCEDEHFDFFDEAKEFALGCLSQKPIITQTEVNRNDFGECTDHCDLGTVWSWEDAVGRETDAEPAKSVFTKDDLKRMADGNDPEFDDDDFYFNNGLIEDVATTEVSFKNREDFSEFARLCREVGIIDGADLRLFMDEVGANDDNILDKLREYRAELGSDFQIRESAKVPEGEERLAANANGDYLVKASSGHGYTVFNRSDVAIGGFGGDDDDFAVRRFKVGDINESKKPVINGKTIKELVETMEENEDQVECAGCEELFSKSDCFHKDGIGWLCGDCEDRIVKCTWCEDLYDRSECRYEVDLGWLCDRCEAAIKSRGEALTFREGNYWDFLDEDASDVHDLGNEYDGGYPEEYDLATIVKDSINHLVYDLGKDSAAEDFVDDVIKDLENNFDIYVPDDMVKYSDWCSAVACEVSRQLNNADEYSSVLDESTDIDDRAGFANINDGLTWLSGKVDMLRDNVAKIVRATAFPKYFKSDTTGKTPTSEYSAGDKCTYTTSLVMAMHYDTAGKLALKKALDQAVNSFNSEIKPKFAQKAANDFVSNAIDKVFDSIELTTDVKEMDPFTVKANYTGKLLEVIFTLTVVMSAGAVKKKVNKLEEADELKEYLIICPECGKESFDTETGICVDCGFN